MATAVGYADANDCDALRTGPIFKMAVGRLPETGIALCSQPTMTRLENLPGAEIIVRGDSHYGRPEAMAWCERQRVGYVFGLAGNAVLTRLAHGDVTRTLLDWDAFRKRRLWAALREECAAC